MLDPVFLRRADDGRISIFDERDKFMACFKNGQWVDGLIFQDYELDDFTIIEDETEIWKILEQARNALHQPLKILPPK